MTVEEAIQNALARLTLDAQNVDMDYPDDNRDLSATFPVGEIAQCGFTVKILDTNDADVLPRLQVQSNKGLIEIERCPFAPLILMSSDGRWDGAEVAAIFQQAGITALKLDDFDNIPEWQGRPAVSWLFPQRLSEAFALFDTLRGQRERYT